METWTLFFRVNNILFYERGANMKYYWNKTVRCDEAYALSKHLFDTYGLDYTGGWYSVCYPCNGYMAHCFVVQAESDDPTMLELGFRLVRPVEETL